MMQQNDFITKTELPGVFIITRPTFEDPRGFFRETFRNNDLEKQSGYTFEIAQANHSRSSKGTLRGIHIAPWHKLVTVTNGIVQQVVTDFREDSPTFGKYISLHLGDDNRSSVLVPAGCGNSFLVLSDTTDYFYLASDYWEPGKEKAVIYNDPDLQIHWENPSPILSEKDLQNSTVKQLYKITRKT